MEVYRQGDVIIMRVEDDLTHGEEINRDQLGRTVLAYGEVTGHAHAIRSKKATLYKNPKLDECTDPAVKRLAGYAADFVVEDAVGGEGKFSAFEEYPVALLDVQEEEVNLEHDEHDTICLKKGKYVVLRQREYSPDELRIVAD